MQSMIDFNNLFTTFVRIWPQQIWLRLIGEFGSRLFLFLEK